MPDHKSVTGTCYFKVQIPAEIFLTGFFASLHALFAQLADQPLRHIVSETARIDEIVFWLGHVKSRAFESDDRSNFRVHSVMAILTLRKSQVPDKTGRPYNGGTVINLCGIMPT